MSRVKHVMVDLETMGVGQYAPVLSIGAVVFDPRGDYISSANYYRLISQPSMTVETSTLVWWLKQGDKLLNLLQPSPNSITRRMVASSFTSWLKMHHPSEEYRFWCHGLDFDMRLFKELFESNFSETETWAVLFKYNDGRDTRTIFEAANFDYKAFPRYGEFHNALDDAITQAKAVQHCFKVLRREYAPPPTTAPQGEQP